MFKALKVDLLYSIAWHPQTDDLFERSNQTAEIALRYFIATLENEKLWPTVLSKMSALLNNFIKYSSISLAPTQIIYGFKTREALDLLRVDVSAAATDNANDVPAANSAVATVYSVINNAENDNVPAVSPLASYQPHHIDAKNAIAFAALRMKELYNRRHQPRFFKVGDLVNLRLHRGYRVSAIKSKKLGQQLIGPFPIIERIGRLAYRLRLPSVMKIHDVVSIAHLESATDPAKDPYQRRRPPMSAVVIDGEDEYEVEKLLQKRSIRRGRGWSTQYLVRWLGYGPEDDTWETESELRRNASEMIDTFEARNGPTVGINSSLSTLDDHSN